WRAGWGCARWWCGSGALEATDPAPTRSAAEELAQPDGVYEPELEVLDLPARGDAHGERRAVHLERLQPLAPRSADHREGDRRGREEARRLLVHEHPDDLEPGGPPLVGAVPLREHLVAG